PHIMGIGPVEAIPAALRYAGLKQDDMDWIELNEAFAAQSLAVIDTLGLDPAKVNPMGGAIALGHPLGATGAIRSATVVHALRRKNLKYGMVTMCVGMGQGAAGIFERVRTPAARADSRKRTETADAHGPATPDRRRRPPGRAPLRRQRRGGGAGQPGDRLRDG